MKKDNRSARLLRWYPPTWRERYGAGFAALLDDTYGTKSVPWRERWSIATKGVLERAHEVGVTGSPVNANGRLLAGSQLVLCGWSLFIVAGAIFAKFTEHWKSSVSSVHRTLPYVGDVVVQTAGIVGVLLVLAAAAFVLPSLVRHVRRESWHSVRRELKKSALALSISIALTTGVALRAHFLNYHQRNGGSPVYVVIVLLAGFAVLATLATMTTTALSLTRQIELSRRLLRTLSFAALTLSVLMATIAVGSGIWWISEVRFAPNFLQNSIGSGILSTSNAFPPALLLMAVLMFFGLAMALFGATRIVSGFNDHVALPETAT